MGIATGIEKQIKELPAKAQREVADFVEFLSIKYQKKGKASPQAEKQYWMKVAETSLNNVWDNKEDDVYHELLKG